jgi:hypothetical protein
MYIYTHTCTHTAAVDSDVSIGTACVLCEASGEYAQKSYSHMHHRYQETAM